MKRYAPMMCDGSIIDMMEYPDGGWVRYSDVENSDAIKELVKEIKLLREELQRARRPVGFGGFGAP